jgi:phosphohistidine swiveling domain-containing protein
MSDQLVLDAIPVTPMTAVGAPLWIERGDLPPVSAASDKIILVANRAGPDVLGLLVVSAGVVCESRALTGHVAILARESCTPCMVGVSGLMRFRTADEVSLRPGEGVVVGRWAASM